MQQPLFGKASGVHHEATPINVILMPQIQKKNNVLIRPVQFKMKDVVRVWSEALCSEQFQCAQRNCKSVRDDDYDEDYDSE